MKNISKRWFCLLLGICMLFCAACALAEAPAYDPSPAIYVAQKTANSVVGVITKETIWDSYYRTTQDADVAMGSGVVIREGGYILTNNHVIADGSTFDVLMPTGERTPATLVGADSSTDIAVLKLDDADMAAKLVPAEIGASTELAVGATVIAIGNPGGETLANTVTQGIVSALERNNISASRTTREIAYIQHSAPINNGNSGGGLFNFKGQLVGINTLKYAGSAYDNVTFEGLGFAIPVETTSKISSDLIEYGKVRRATMGVEVTEYLDGPEEPLKGYAPSGVYITNVIEGTPAENAGFRPYDYVYSVNGVRVTSYAELTTQLDLYTEGDTVELQVARYANIYPAQSEDTNLFDYYFGGGTVTAGPALNVSGGYEMVTLNVTLAFLDLE